VGALDSVHHSSSLLDRPMENAIVWETAVVVVILFAMLAALIYGGDRLDHWTFQRPGVPSKSDKLMLYGMTLAQVRRLRVFYISQTGDNKLERL